MQPSGREPPLLRSESNAVTTCGRGGASCMHMHMHVHMHVHVHDIPCACAPCAHVHVHVHVHVTTCAPTVALQLLPMAACGMSGASAPDFTAAS